MARRGGHEEDDDTPPWLAPAEPDERGGTIVSGRSFNLWLLLLAGLLVLVVALVYAMIAKPEDDGPVYATVDGEVPLIRAPEAPFKVRPADPGGLDLEGGNQSAFEAAGGLDPGGDLNFDALPEEPIDRSQIAVAAPAAPSVPAPVRAPVEKAPAATPAPKLVVERPKPAAGPPEVAAKADVKTAPKNETKEPVANDGSSYSLQLGAFSSESKANAAWKSFTGRYSYLADLNKSVIALERDGEKLYRLRATGISSRAQANNLCGRLRAAGDQCSVIE
jgi:cell division septation protein DedD